MASYSYFKDEMNQKHYNEKGYVVLDDFVDANTLGEIESFFDENMPKTDKPFYVSNWCNDYEINKNIDETIRGKLDANIDKYLKNHRVIIGLMFAKNATKDSAYYVHRDWALVDEREFSSLHFWMPLVDIDERNGNLFVYEGSHKVGPIVRGSPSFDYPAEGILHKVKDKFGKKDIYLKKGSVLIFDHRLKHGSRTNKSEQVRKVIGLSIIPKETSLIHYHKHKDDRIEIFKVDDAFYLNFNLVDMPSKENSIGIVDNKYLK